jgi:hypothetical protein
VCVVVCVCVLCGVQASEMLVEHAQGCAQALLQHTSHMPPFVTLGHTAVSLAHTTPITRMTGQKVAEFFDDVRQTVQVRVTCVMSHH